MGLFDSLKSKINSEAVEKIVNTVQQEVDKAVNTVSESVNSKPAQTSQPAAEAAPAYTEPKKTAVIRDRFNDFDDIISRNFTDIEVRKNVPAAELEPGCHPACTPVQFMFYRNSAPVLAVVLVKENNYRGMNVVATKKICEKLGIKYIRFYHEYENAESYVVDRIRKNL